MTQTYPLVSVIAVCYNHSRFIKLCLDSIEQQIYPNLELIIIDSNSPDNSVEIINEWLASTKLRYKFLRRDTNHVVSQNLNFGLQHINGDYIQVISTDDKLHPGKISSQMAIFDSDPDAMMVFSNAYYIDGNDSFYLNDDGITPKLFQSQGHLIKLSELNEFASRITNNCFIIPHASLIKREVYSVVGFYDENLLIEDWDFYLRFYKLGLKSRFDENIFTYYRSILGSVWTTRNYRLFSEQIKIFQKHHLFKKWRTVELYFQLFRGMKNIDKIRAFWLLVSLGRMYWAFVYLFELYTFNRQLRSIWNKLRFS